MSLQMEAMPGANSSATSAGVRYGRGIGGGGRNDLNGLHELFDKLSRVHQGGGVRQREVSSGDLVKFEPREGEAVAAAGVHLFSVRGPMGLVKADLYFVEELWRNSGKRTAMEWLRSRQVTRLQANGSGSGHPTTSSSGISSTVSSPRAPPTRQHSFGLETASVGSSAAASSATTVGNSGFQLRPAPMGRFAAGYDLTVGAGADVSVAPSVVGDANLSALRKASRQPGEMANNRGMSSSAAFRKAAEHADPQSVDLTGLMYTDAAHLVREETSTETFFDSD